MIKPYPLLCAPLLMPRIWGGRRLADAFGQQPPSGGQPPAAGPIGEAWLAADLPEGSSSIANGPLAGRTIDTARVYRLDLYRRGSLPLKRLDGSKIVAV